MTPVNPNDYCHDLDQKALEMLRAIPGFSAALKAFMKIMNEKMLHGVNMASKVRLGPDQLPEIYNMLPPICRKLGIEEPELYLEMDPVPNAYTYGDTKVFITVTSGLVESMNDDELRAVLAHECGHIACRHVLYHTMGSLILNGAAEMLNLGLITVPLKLAFFHWERCSELSCDRAAAIYMGSADPVVETMIRLAGGPKSITNRINKDLYMQQADEYEQLIGESKWDRILQYYALMNSTHPFTSVRASQIRKWCETAQFYRLAQ